MPTPPRQSIGAVIAKLAEDFPDITVSKVRFLEAEGLITPERTNSGYRQYTAADVDRLRYILSAQRDRFWPLKVIREALDALDRGLEPSASGDEHRPRPPAPAADTDAPSRNAVTAPGGPRLTVTELAQAAGARPELVAALVSFGLLRPDDRGLVSGESLRIARSAQELADYGIEARHLRLFRTAAEREVGLIDYAAGTATHPDPVDLARACLALHLALVKDELGRRS